MDLATAPDAPLVSDVVATVLDAVGDDHAVLRSVVDRLDRAVAADALTRTARLWDVSAADIGRMFGVSRQAASAWMADKPPAGRRDDVAALSEATDLLDRWIKRERIAAVVRRPVDSFGGRTRLDVALSGDVVAVRDELRDTFDVGRVAP